MSELRMAAYYYGFDKTDSREIDLILSAVASAGKGYHHTDSWNNDTFEDGVSYCGNFKGKNYIEWIQNAANEAAKKIQSLEAEIKLLKAQAHFIEKEATEKLEKENAEMRNRCDEFYVNNQKIIKSLEDKELKLAVAVEALKVAQANFEKQGLHKQGYRVMEALATIGAKDE
jgi:hypothetical protein